MDERLTKAQESAKAARTKATTAAKARVEKLKAQEKTARAAAKKSLDGLKDS